MARFIELITKERGKVFINTNHIRWVCEVDGNTIVHFHGDEPHIGFKVEHSMKELFQMLQVRPSQSVIEKALKKNGK